LFGKEKEIYAGTVFRNVVWHRLISYTEKKFTNKKCCGDEVCWGLVGEVNVII